MTVAAEQRNARHASRRKFAALSKCILSARRNFWDVLEIIIRRCMQEHMSFAALNVIHLTGDEISSQRFFLRIKKRNRLNRPSNCLWLIFGTTQTEKAQKEFMQSNITLQLIQNYLKTNKIAFVSVNMNGYEYAILEELVDPIKNNNEEIVFCQIDVILSNPDIEQLFTDEYFNFDAFIKKLIESHYVPIHAAAYLEHKKVLFVHSDDVYCLRTLDYSGFTFNNMSKHSPLSQF
uniref:DUF3800 domain-containing protein n=1 Tax=Ascaris lumbricoides TaxID=6252 RepID=A0A0M3HPU1_ASCLU